MSKIKEFLDKAAKAYYSGDPIISDEQFDKLASMHSYDSVGSSSTKNTATHYNQLFSLQKFYEDEGGSNPLIGEKDITYSVKLDGAVIAALYMNGNLVRVLTRGDGIDGVDITDKFLSTNLIPKTIPYSGILQVSGEIVAPKDVPNSRNYAAGSLNLKDINEFRTRAISFFAHGVYPTLASTYDEDMVMLSRFGFNTVRENELDKIYPSDGIVFRVNSNNRAEELGFTSRHPKFAYALKERQAHVETQILDVEWNTGRTGRVTPIAILRPVTIDGKEVSRATLNNPGFIEALDLRIGDTVAVRLAGMIIPEVVHKVDA